MRGYCQTMLRVRSEVLFILFILVNTLPTRVVSNITMSKIEERSFTIDPNTHTFLKDGVPFQYVSGSLHYFRIPTEYWPDRLEKARMAGLDAIEFYIPWNFHETEEGQYTFVGDHDFESFIRLISEHKLLAIVRVGPYICAEWTFGGLPPWLLRKNPEMVLRSSQPAYFLEVVKWFDVLLPKLKRYLYTNGGPIIMVQLENEYGSYYTCDSEYMSRLYDEARHHLGNEVILFTIDGNSVNLLHCGSPDSRYLATVDFAPTLAPCNESFSPLESFRPGQPWINSEYYTGHFDTWGKPHAHRDATLVVQSLINQLTYSLRVNVNFYMFHGGTTFGFWNGASPQDQIITSYDNDAPVSESGDVSIKYALLQKAIHEFKKQKCPPLPENITKFAYGTISLKPMSHILHNLTQGVDSPEPMSMEFMRQYEGFMVYRTALPRAEEMHLSMILKKFRDIAHIFSTSETLDDIHWYASVKGEQATVTVDRTSVPHHTQLLFLLENTGYIDYGSDMWNNVKGLVDEVEVNNHTLGPWTMLPVERPLNLSEIKQRGTWPVPGTLFTGELYIQTENELFDTYIQPDSFSRGIISINGHVLGRFNQRAGPQLALYIPKQFLQQGSNHLVLLELDEITNENLNVNFIDQAIWMK